MPRFKTYINFKGALGSLLRHKVFTSGGVSLRAYKHIQNSLISVVSTEPFFIRI